MLRLPIALACGALALSAGAGAKASAPPCPPGASSSATPEDHVIACAGASAITSGVFQHWRTVARKFERHAKPKQILDEVMDFLISADWVFEEARARDIAVSDASVLAKFKQLRRAQFPHERELTKFLKSSGETVDDLLLRVRLELLSERVQQSVLAAHKGAPSRQEAISRFVKAFKAKWQSETYCEPDYAVADCGHVQAPL